MRNFTSACSLLLVAAAMAACHARVPATSPARSTPQPAPAAPVRPPAPQPPAAAASPSAPAALSDSELFRRKSLEQLNAEHPLDDAFFDYDQNALRDDARASLQHDAQWLAKWPQTAIRIEGYCDERGSAEYNMALGARRADAVREYLTSLGVKGDRIQTRSLGKESPFCHGEDESCWSQNRRGHFVITEK